MILLLRNATSKAVHVTNIALFHRQRVLARFKFARVCTLKSNLVELEPRRVRGIPTPGGTSHCPIQRAWQGVSFG